MTRHLFLTGPTGSGKSTLLRRSLGTALSRAGGFVTEAVRGSYGELVGFALSPAVAAGGVAGFVPERFLDCSRFPPRTDNEVFRDTGVRLLQEAVLYPYALLDEFGGFELIIPQFRSALYALFRSELPIVGALKTEAEAEAMRQALGLGEKCRGYAEELRRFLREDENTCLIEVRSPNDPLAAEAIADWLREYAG